jgi:hypothetical protein
MAEKYEGEKTGGFPDEEVKRKFFDEHVKVAWDPDKRVATVTIMFYCRKPPCPLSGEGD